MGNRLGRLFREHDHADRFGRPHVPVVAVEAAASDQLPFLSIALDRFNDVGEPTIKAEVRFQQSYNS